MIQPALLGGVFIGVLSALPVIQLGNCCCLWVVGGGMIAAYLDQAPGRMNNLARGALDGLLAGIFGAIVWLIAAMAVDSVMAPLQQRLISDLLNGPVDLPPQVRIWLEGAQGDAGIFPYLSFFVVYLFGGMIFATLGGVLGALFFWRDGVPPALGGPPPLPPLDS